MPSRSYHQDASGLPMISLMLSSSNSGSMGRRNGRISSKLMARTSQGRKPSLNRASASEEGGLCRRLHGADILVLLLFRVGLLGPVQLENRVQPDLPDGLLRAGFLAVVFSAAQLAFDLEMSALLQRARELCEFAEDHATMPLGVRDVLAVLLVRRLGGQGERREAAVVVGANFCVAAEEADKGDFVLVHDGVSVSLNFPILIGSRWAEPCEWARLPSAKECFLGGCPLGRNHDPKGGAAEAERRRAAGRRIGPEAVTEQTAGYETADTLWIKVIRTLGQEICQNHSFIRATNPTH